MGNNEAKVIATFFIWLAFSVVSVTAMITGVAVDGGPLIVIAVLLVAGAVVATQSVWQSGASAADKASKAKRRSRVERFLNDISDAEIEELRARLMDKVDGELASLEELLEERSRRGR